MLTITKRSKARLSFGGGLIMPTMSAALPLWLKHGEHAGLKLHRFRCMHHVVRLRLE